MKNISATAPGKAILFGEHAVVWGYPAIAMGIPLRTKCIIEENPTNGIQINFKKYNISIEATSLNHLKELLPVHFHQFYFGLAEIQKNCTFPVKNINIILTSSLIPNAGLGSSASSAVAFIFALNEYFNCNLEKSRLIELSYEMEKITHGKPSGIDNKVCIFGNLMFFQEGFFHYIKIPKDFNLLITYTNIKHDTKKAIDKISQLKSEKPIYCDLIFEKIGFYTEIAELELVSENLKEVGKLMDSNQKLLENLNLSTKEISEIVQIARNNHAFGSKITGAGLGGCVISLGDKDDLESISDLLKKKGYQSYLTNIDREGVIVQKGT